MPEYLTAKQFMEIAQVSKSTFYRLVESGSIKAIKIGNRWKVHRSSLEISQVA